MIVPSITTSVLTFNFPSANDALTLPLTILSNCKFVTPLAGILYNPAPSPVNEPLIVPLLTVKSPVLISKSLFVKSTRPLKTCKLDPLVKYNEELSVIIVLLSVIPN